MAKVSEYLTNDPMVISTADGLCALIAGPFILGHEEAKAVIDRLLKFYEKYTPEDIDANNALYRRPERPDSPGFVYLIRRSDGLHKIGCTTDIVRRMGTLQAKHGPLELIHAIECKRYERAEQDLHAKFRSKHVRHEWFNLSPEDVAYIKTIERM